MSDDPERAERARQRKLATAKDLESRGFVDHAVQTYLKAGAPEEAARVLRGAGRASDAGSTLLAALGVDIDGVAGLDEKGKLLARLAADCFEQAGDEDRASRLRQAAAASSGASPVSPAQPSASAPQSMSARPTAAPVQPGRPSVSPVRSGPPTGPTRPTGEDDDNELHRREAGWREASAETIEQSIQQMLASGKKGAAARIAWDVGQYARALAWFEELEMQYSAGSCLASLGRKEEALERMLREPEAGPRYRKCCFAIVDLTFDLGRLDFDIDRYLNRFVQEGPRDRDEIPAYIRLADLYRRMGFERGAQRCLVKVLELDADNVAAKALLRESQRAGSQKPPPKASVAPLPPMRDGLPPVPSLEEFVQLARKHAPPKPPPPR